LRKFKVNVNGSFYEVEVEELGGSATTVGSQKLVAQAPVAAPVAAVAPKPVAPPVQTGGTTVLSPMPGVIKDVRVKVGDKVDPSTVVVILEAMKMENEIFAGVTGTISAVNTSKDSSVNTDDLLVTIV
jgi:biotin carboxyl carrier protein